MSPDTSPLMTQKPVNSSNTSSPSKSPVRNLLIFLAIGVLVYALFYFFVFNKKTKMVDVSQDTPTSNASMEELGYDPAETVNVTKTDNGFSPQSVTIKAGQSVTWINDSGTTATVDSSPHPAHTDFPFLNLGEFEDGNSMTLVFPDAGTYKYHDHLNSSHFGTVVVE